VGVPICDRGIEVHRHDPALFACGILVVSECGTRQIRFKVVALISGSVESLNSTQRSRRMEKR
jgi:hypothetical protein